MKRFWHTCLAMIATATMTAGVAHAQNNWNAPSQIGSYQSILSRAGYSQDGVATAAATTPQMGAGMANMPSAGVQNGGMSFNGSSTRNVPMGVQNDFQGSMPMGSSTGMGMNGAMSSGMTGQPMNMGMAQPQMSGQMSAAPMTGAPGCSTCAGNGPAFGSSQPMSGPVMGTPNMSGPSMGAPLIDTGYGNASMGNAYSGVVQGMQGIQGDMGCSGGPGPDLGYHAPVYGAPFQLGQSVGQVFNGGGRGRGRGRGKSANWVAGLYALSFARDYEDDRQLSRNPSGDILSTRDADEGDFGGYGVSLTRRSCNGRGIELRYWAFNPDATAQLDGVAVASVLPTLDQLQHVPTGRYLDEIYGAATNHVLVRNTDINNFEVNLLNNGGSYQTRRGRAANFELLGGFRWFQFDETLSYISNNPPLSPVSPTQTFYQSSVQNDLVGFQLGARNELCLNGRWRAFAGLSTGIFNNHIQTRQRFFDQAGSVPVLTSGPSTGRDFDYSDSKNDVALLGELDLGLTYMLSHRLRARAGYRTFGVAGLALAGDQIPNDFTDTARIQRANSNGSLLLHGGYFGLEACF